MYQTRKKFLSVSCHFSTFMGWLYSLMLTGLDHGAKLVTLPRFESESFLKSVHQHRVLL